MTADKYDSGLFTKYETAKDKLVEREIKIEKL